MNLREYLKLLRPADREAFAAQCDTTALHLRCISRGERNAKVELCVKIEIASKCFVTCEEVNPAIPWKYLKERKLFAPKRAAKPKAKPESAAVLAAP